MKVEKRDGVIHVQIPQKLFKKLEEIISEREKAGETPKLKLAPAVYLIYQILVMPIRLKDMCDDGWVPFCSQVYKDILHFSKYMQLMVDNKLIMRHKKNYSTESHECYRYKLAKSYSKQVVKPLEVKAHKLFVKKRKNNIQNSNPNHYLNSCKLYLYSNCPLDGTSQNQP